MRISESSSAASAGIRNDRTPCGSSSRRQSRTARLEWPGSCWHGSGNRVRSGSCFKHTPAIPRKSVKPGLAWRLRQPRGSFPLATRSATGDDGGQQAVEVAQPRLRQRALEPIPPAHEDVMVLAEEFGHVDSPLRSVPRDLGLRAPVQHIEQGWRSCVFLHPPASRIERLFSRYSAAIACSIHEEESEPRISTTFSGKSTDVSRIILSGGEIRLPQPGALQSACCGRAASQALVRPASPAALPAGRGTGRRRAGGTGGGTGRARPRDRRRKIAAGGSR